MRICCRIFRGIWRLIFEGLGFFGFFFWLGLLFGWGEGFADFGGYGAVFSKPTGGIDALFFLF